ncbi:chitinase-like protein Idgf4 [Uranotaenia lowii]|uniref:chitinase-like protein Idgf4 n=1 Tax=Uranotaenia lowii TaxID=190385 RepID=UPI00247936D8|nr:chitinase-like protein Idgf4 [Uranotaenia lowii]
MWWKTVTFLFFLILVEIQSQAVNNGSTRVFCYYDGSNSLREGFARVTLTDIKPALPFCTHLIYGFAGIDPTTNRIRALNESLDLDSGKGQYRAVTALKKDYPHLKVLLSVGFNRDRSDEPPHGKYLTLLENAGMRMRFVNSVYSLLKTYGFDGLDLAWQFPQTKPKSTLKWTDRLWDGFRQLFTDESTSKPKPDARKEAFAEMVRDLKHAFRAGNFELCLTVLPHVSEPKYLDVYTLRSNVDYVNLAAFDLLTPERNPNEASYTSPIDHHNPVYYRPSNSKDDNLERAFEVWRETDTKLEKIIVGIPTHGRGWKLSKDSETSGVPPIAANGSAIPGPFNGKPGLYSYPEVCTMLADSVKIGRALVKVEDLTKRLGVYAYRLPDAHGDDGIWISYGDPDSARNKVAYARKRHLGGLSIFDLGNDDFRGTCGTGKFPILKAAVNI